jgi:two-component system phosphate regulon response regulator PhoB
VGDKKILVVDDESDMRIFVSVVAETMGFVSVTAKDGAEALEKARIHLPDLVILDVMMPNIDDGIKAYQLFRMEPKLSHIPIIMLSAIAKKTFFHSIRMLRPSRGAQIPEPEGYMEKPPDADELSKLISELLPTKY